MLRRSPRVLGLWAAAAVLAATSAAVVIDDLTALRRRAARLGPPVAVAVARTDLPLGATVTSADLATRRVHASQLPAGVVRGPTRALGRVVRVPVVAGGYLHRSHLAARGRRGLAAGLPAGTRAVRIEIDGGLRPRPGTPVDVYLAPERSADPTGSSTGRAQVATAGAIVITADQASVTLLVDEEGAAALATATARGRLFLAVVPPEEAVVPGALTRR